MPLVAAEIVQGLVDAAAIETQVVRDVQLDVESVLGQYIRDDQEITEKAKDLVASRNLTQAEFGRMKRLLADQRKVKIGDDAIDYLLDQLVEMLMHSGSVDEIFAEDHELRRLMRDPLRRHQVEDERLHEEVRGQLRHVKEGTSVWEVEYRRMMEDVKRRKGL